MPSVFDRLRNGWNAFINNKDPSKIVNQNGYVNSTRPDRVRFHYGNEKSIVTAIYTRIAMDAAAIDIRHVKVDENGNFLEVINSSLNQALNVSANLDETGRAFRQDVIMSLFDEGCISIVPVDTNRDPNNHDSFEIETLRVGKILEWYPESIRTRVYNERLGIKQDILMNKTGVCIIENPFYQIMNEPNSLTRRLVTKLALLDFTDEQNSSGKLDLIIQLPYVIRNDLKRAQAEQRRKDIEMQLASSKYGVAYTDGTERITQLNRAVENQLFDQVKYLTEQLYAQFGITDAILNGSATEAEMLNYYNRTVEPVVSAITDEMYRKFLTKTARTQHQSIMYFRDPFKLAPVNSIAELADKFTRNEILSSNEVRAIIGFKPSNDPRANELRNKNIGQSAAELMSEQGSVEEQPMEGEEYEEGSEITEDDYNQMMSELEDLDSQIDELEKGL